MSLHPVDFAQPRARVPRVGAVLLACGVAALVAAALCQQRWATERDQARQNAERREEAARAQRAARPAVLLPNADEKRLQRVLAERGRPWLAALRSVESATVAPVFLLALNADTSNQALRLDAEAPSFEHALAYVQVLPDRTGLVSAHLLSHEQVNDASTGRPVVRFSVLARWSAP
jgi:hypothetical protein